MSETRKDIRINFSNRNTKFEVGYSDYSPGQEEDIMFNSGQKAIDNSRTYGYMLEGNNISDDLFMFVTTKIEGLVPNSKYHFLVESLSIATNVPKGLVGIGGAPGEGVSIKIGCYNQHPEIINTGEYVTTNFDHGHQKNDGTDAFVIGDFARENNDDRKNHYEIKTFAPKKHLTSESNSQGEMWLIFGTDSGFEGKTAAYFIAADVTLVQVQSFGETQIPNDSL